MQPANVVGDRCAGDEFIQCEQLTKRYSVDFLVVDRFDLRVHRGEIFGLLGPNGTGDYSHHQT